MATYTTNINLKKPAQSDKIRIADFNGNADSIDDAFGAGFGQSSAPSVDDEINSLASGLAIISNGDVHAAITAGQYVYVRGHSTLDDGLYIASSNISANGALSSSNLDADTSGGLNSLNNNMTNMVKGKYVQLPLTTLGTSWSQTAREIGTIDDLFGLSGKTIMSITMSDANFSPAANSIWGIYGGKVYVAATQTTTLSDINSSYRKILVTYMD